MKTDIVSWAVFNLVYNWMKIRDRNLKNRIFHGVYLVSNMHFQRTWFEVGKHRFK